MFGRYEYREGTSNKFWQLGQERGGSGVVVVWGRIERPNTWRSQVISRAEAWDRVRKKLAKGYREAMGGLFRTPQIDPGVIPDFEVDDAVAPSVEKKQKQKSLKIWDELAKITEKG